MKYFAGIGSRDCPTLIEARMAKLSKVLTYNGYTLRSGNAHGADQAFAKGVLDNKAQIWLPWKGFNDDFQKLYPDHEYRLVSDRCPEGESDMEAWDSVKQFHPYYDDMESSGHIKFKTFMDFMTRNYRQVRGYNEPDSEFVICWTPNGEDVGGTAQAIRVARHYNIPVYNMFHLTVEEILREIEKQDLIN